MSRHCFARFAVAPPPVTTGSTLQYLYDEDNRLACASTGQQAPSPSCNGGGLTEFVYDHAGARKIKKAANATIYPNQYYTDFGGGAGNQYKHIFIGSQRILTKQVKSNAPDQQHWFYHPDHLGSTSMVTNESAQLREHILYFPFGEVWVEENSGAIRQDFFFTAKELDPETKFYDFGARYLNPRFSKWMSADPADRISASAPIITLNPYQYGRHNPARFFDPTGAFEVDSNAFDAFQVAAQRARQAVRPVEGRPEGAITAHLETRGRGVPRPA